MADDIDLCGVFFGLFDRNTDAMYYGNKKPVTDLYYLLPTVDYSSSSSSSSKKKISSLEFDDVDNYTYTGKARKPAVTIYDGDYKLKNGTDYTLSYKNNKEIGEGTITVTGKGKYTGTKKLQFNIVPKKPTIKLSEKSGKITVSWGKITGAEKYQIYYSTDGKKYKKLANAAELLTPRIYILLAVFIVSTAFLNSTSLTDSRVSRINSMSPFRTFLMAFSSPIKLLETSIL